MDKKVLITGASGLIGRELHKQLHDLGYNVIGTDNNFRYPTYQTNLNLINSELIDFVKNTENDFDYIFHLSAINGTKYFYEIPTKLIENNIMSDFAIFNFVQHNPKSKLIYASSSEVVAGSNEFPTPELTDIKIENIHNPRWSYRLGKIVSENYLKNSDIDFLILRFFNIYGPNSGTGHFIKDILDKISKNDFTLIGASETRSFCRVEDSVDAIVNIFDKVSNEIINIGSDEEITIYDAANIIADNLNKQIVWQPIEGNLGSVKRRKPDLTKLYKYYPSFKPALFKDSLRDIINANRH